MAKILVAEDDQFFRDALCDLLRKKGHEIFEASNGKLAQDIILIQNFDLILSDIQMPGLTGIELLRWLKDKGIKTPFVLMTGFSMLLETEAAYELGAIDVMLKPFDQIKLLDLIEKVAPTKSKPVARAPEKNISQDFCKVSLEEFVVRPKVEFDLYVRISDFKYAKIAQKGEELEKDRLTQYKNKGVKYLYLTKDDFQKLICLNLNIGRIIKDRDDISTEKKMSFMKYTGEVILEKAFSKDVDVTSFEEAQTYLKITTDVITDSPTHLDLLKIISQHSDDIYAHSVGVALFTIMLAKKLGFESSFALNKVSMAALFHDVGKKEIDLAILNKPRYLHTVEERKTYESHAIRSKQILMAMKGTPSDVVQIVDEHHEDALGQGYPVRKPKKFLHPLSRIVYCTNLFVEQAMKDKVNPGCSGPEAIAVIEKQYEGYVDHACVKALKSLYNMDL